MTIKKTKEEEGSLFFFSFFFGFLFELFLCITASPETWHQFLLSLIERKKKQKKEKGKKAEKKPKRRTNEFRKPNHERIFWLALADDDMIMFLSSWAFALYER
ncbi:unnamed protein product [Brassica rapa]|uniref:Uncharacterized protein n=2 Tax=Brassica TaxID=3705 RepID=A0A8D9DR55_BRACM|nr:unnamed protein product [Brassica napus]CAG7878127.1 unnamed protein product [Brassica rapa]